MGLGKFTPPTSPGQAMGEDDEVLDGMNDAVEVIDLDEELGDLQEDEDDGLEVVPEEGSVIQQDIKDNSLLVFKEHTSTWY